MRKLALVIVAVVTAGVGAALVWRRNPRIGTRLVNESLNPILVERGIAGAGRSELGTLEHTGRRTGTRHLTPIHPVPTDDGFRISVPLGAKCEWAQNVLAAGHCRMQLHDMVYELDEPVLLAAGELPDAVTPVAAVLDRLGFQYLQLRRFAERPGALDEEPAGEPISLQADSPEPVGAAAS
jgi:hypothetical protein